MRETSQAEIKTASKFNGFSVMALSSESESRSFTTSAGRLAAGTFAMLRKISRRTHITPGQAIALLLLLVCFLFGSLYVVLLVEKDKRFEVRRAAAVRNASNWTDDPALNVARNV